MSRIRSKNTKPEIVVRKFLFQRGFRFRIHDKRLPGKPDVVLPKFKTAIFINGCFWHGHRGCRYFVIPKTRTEWWLSKINRNREIDRISRRKLKGAGWRIITVYECSLKRGNAEKTLEKLIREI